MEGQDARVFAKNPAAPPFQNTWDIRQGYVELGGPETKSFGLRAGRQELNFGEQRLIGSSNWTNTARTFDAVRVTMRHQNYRLDLFSASVVNPVDGTWDHHQQGNDIHGVYGGIEKLVPGATIEPYFFWRLQPRLKNESGKIANLDMRVPGVRWVGGLPLGFDYGLEMVKEMGSLGSDSVHAWAGHWVLGRTAKSLRMSPRVFMEYNYASGDKNSSDGVRGTFDQLYPTGHDKYGLADQVGWRNIKDLRAGITVKPRNNWTAALTYNDWYLASRFDALYNAASAAIARSPNGAAGTHVGQELDAQATWKIAKPLQAGMGFGHIFPGEFLKKTTPGKAYNFPYLMFTYAF